MEDIVFLTLVEILEVHTRQIEEYGGSLGVRDIRLLESAIAVPESSFGGSYLHPDLFEMASAYAYHISMNHPFVDGNKRCALVSASVFLELNGFILKEKTPGQYYEVMMDVVNGKISKKELAGIFRKFSKKLY